jgi:pyrroline-5-carboxylate reductase
MGSAILLGLLNAISLGESKDAAPRVSMRFIACTNTEESALALRCKVGRHISRVRILHQQNRAAVTEADVVVLWVKPYYVKNVLHDPGIREALAGKLVISLVAGLSAKDLQSLIVSPTQNSDAGTPYVARAIPNLAARFGQSMTIVERSDPPLPPQQESLLALIFNSVGQVKPLDSSLVDVGSVLITTCLASLTIPLDGLLDGAVVEGLPRHEAMKVATQGIIGLGTMLKNGSHLVILRESISSPRGCTIQTLLALEKRGTRTAFTDALLQGTQHLQQVRTG